MCVKCNSLCISAVTLCLVCFELQLKHSCDVLTQNAFVAVFFLSFHSVKKKSVLVLLFPFCTMSTRRNVLHEL